VLRVYHDVAPADLTVEAITGHAGIRWNPSYNSRKSASVGGGYSVTMWDRQTGKDVTREKAGVPWGKHTWERRGCCRDDASRAGGLRWGCSCFRVGHIAKAIFHLKADGATCDRSRARDYGHGGQGGGAAGPGGGGEGGALRLLRGTSVDDLGET
jgi:hypothetical protein